MRVRFRTYPPLRPPQEQNMDLRWGPFDFLECIYWWKSDWLHWGEFQWPGIGFLLMMQAQALRKIRWMKRRQMNTENKIPVIDPWSSPWRTTRTELGSCSNSNVENSVGVLQGCFRQKRLYEIESLRQVKISSYEHRGVINRQRRRVFCVSDPTTTKSLEEAIVNGYQWCWTV